MIFAEALLLWEEAMDDLHKVFTYVEENLIDDVKTMESSFTNWALMYVLDRVIREDEKLPEYISGEVKETTKEVVEDFYYEMKYAESLSCNEYGIMFFSIAADQGETLLRYLG